MQGYDICFAFKIRKHKHFAKFQSLLVLIYQQKNSSIDFITIFLKSGNQKTNINDVILVIMNYLIKIVYDKLVKARIDILSIEKLIFNIVIWHYSILNFVVSNWNLHFTLKFQFLLYYSLKIKCQTSTTFHSQTKM